MNKIVDIKGIIYGNEGDVCNCGHMLCYHLIEDGTDGTIQGCQIRGCDCKNTWLEKYKDTSIPVNIVNKKPCNPTGA